MQRFLADIATPLLGCTAISELKWGENVTAGKIITFILTLLSLRITERQAAGGSQSAVISF